MSSNILFVTGTDTNIGKTVISRIILTGARQEGLLVGASKPVETGCALGRDGALVAADGELLWEASGKTFQLDDVAPFRFATPVAPYVAAIKEDRQIDYRTLRRQVEALSADVDLLVVEGAGGLLVPLDETHTYADFVKALDATVVVVVGSRLGCINHAALTFEVLKNRAIDTMGYVFNEFSSSTTDDDALKTNRVAVERAAAAYGLKELAKVSYVEAVDEPSVLCELTNLPEVQPLVRAIIAEFGL